MMNTCRIQLLTSVAAALVLCGQAAPSAAGVLFSYDATTGQFPTDQGWQAYEIDAEGPLTAPNTIGTSADNANAAMAIVDGGSVLHMRDTLDEGSFNLPLYHYAWTPAQQQALLAYGVRFTMVWQGLATTTSGKGNLRFGFNGSEFETQADNIDADNAIEVLGFSSDLAATDGAFHTLEITGQFNGTDFEFFRSVDGGAPVAMTIISNQSPGAVESGVIFGAQSSAGRGADMYIRSITMETLLVPEPASIGLVAIAAVMACAAGRRRSR